MRAVSQNFIAAGAAGFLLAACASPSLRPKNATRPAQEADSCIRAAALAEWEPLDEQTFLTFEPGDPGSHLVRLETPIEGLMQAGDILAVDGDLDGRICSGGIDGIFVEDCGCTSSAIVSIEYLSEKRTAELTGKELIVRAGPVWNKYF